MEGLARRIGILAGGGSLPREIAECLTARGVPVFVLALAGEEDGELAGVPHETVGWGEIGRMISALKRARVTDLVIVGRVRRPDLRRLRPDLGFLLNLPSIIGIVAFGGGDDGVLRRVVAFFERKGIRVVGPQDVAPELVAGRGLLGNVELSGVDTADIELGLEVVRRLGPFDIGQGVVVAGGRVEAIEGAEGTDAMLARVARARGSCAGPSGRGEPGRRGGVLVKRPKPGQEMRVDLPAIGPQTVTRAAEAGLRGIAALSGQVLVAQRADLVAGADAAGIFIAGVEDRGVPLVRHSGGRSGAEAGAWRVRGKRAADRSQQADMLKGRRILDALAGYCTSEAVVVAKGHVLAVEAGEGAEAMLGRVRALRQWGDERSRRRIGVAVLAAHCRATPALVAAAEAAGLAGLALTDGEMAAGVIERADLGGLFLAEIAASGERAR